MKNNKFIILEGAKRLGIALSQGQISQFLIYLEELRRWNKKINLTAVRDSRGIIIRHFLDSLAGLSILPPRKSAPSEGSSLSLMDVGTGAGFPGLPIKICRPEIQLTLVEPRNKKSAFLHYLCGRLGIKGIKIMTARVEGLDKEKIPVGGYDFLMTRALRLDQFLKAAPSLLCNEGKAVLWVAGSGDEVLESLVRLTYWNQPRVISYRLPFDEIERSLIIVSKLKGPVP